MQPESNGLTSLQVGNLRYLGKTFPDATAHIGVLTGDIPLIANHYDQKLIDTASSALTNAPVYIQLNIAPFDQATKSSAIGQYLAAFQQYKPSGKSHTYLGVNAWSAWLLFAKAGSSCGNDLTCTCFYNAAKKIDH